MTAAVHALLAPDPAVPQRDRLLDGDAMAARLTWCLAAGPVERCEPVRARYQVGRSLRVLYRVTHASGTHLVALRTFPGARSAEVHRAAAAAARGGEGLPGVAHDREVGAVLFTFPNDRKLAGLRTLMDGRAELVAYAPEKAATARRLDGHGHPVAYAKAYADDAGARTRGFHDALRERAAAAGLRLPHAISWSQEDRILVCEALAGRRPAPGELGRVGAALATLHGLQPPPGAPRFARLAPPAVREAAAAISLARPDCAAAATALAARLAATAPPPSAAVCLHGDVHPKNVVLADFGAALIDLDQLATGPAAADLGSLLAAVHARRATGAETAAEAGAHARAFLAGYAAVRTPPSPSELRWHVAAALLAERALRGVTRVRRDVLARLPELLAAATETLERRP